MYACPCSYTLVVQRAALGLAEVELRSENRKQRTRSRKSNRSSTFDALRLAYQYVVNDRRREVFSVGTRFGFPCPAFKPLGRPLIGTTTRTTGTIMLPASATLFWHAIQPRAGKMTPRTASPPCRACPPASSSPQFRASRGAPALLPRAPSVVPALSRCPRPLVGSGPAHHVPFDPHGCLPDYLPAGSTCACKCASLLSSDPPISHTHHLLRSVLPLLLACQARLTQ